MGAKRHTYLLDPRFQLKWTGYLVVSVVARVLDRRQKLSSRRANYFANPFDVRSGNRQTGGHAF